jgi:heat shock protein HslJ
MQAEAACIELLGSAASYALDGDTRTLYGADGSEALVFVAM